MTAYELSDGQGNILYSGTIYDSLPLDQVIELRTDEINNYRDIVLDGGFTWNGNLYDSDLLSRSNLTAALTGVNAGITLPSNFTWRTHDNQNIAMNNTDLVTFALSMLQWAETVYGVSWYHKANLQASTTVSAAATYDITVGWPAN